MQLAQDTLTVCVQNISSICTKSRSPSRALRDYTVETAKSLGAQRFSQPDKTHHWKLQLTCPQQLEPVAGEVQNQQIEANA